MDIIFFDNDISHVHANPKTQYLVLGGMTFPLPGQGASHRIHDAGELHQQAVAPSA